MDGLLRILDIQLTVGLFGDGYMADGFAFMPAELSDSLPVAALLAVVILLAGLIVSFIVSDVISA